MHAGSGSRLSGSLRTFCWALLQDGALALEPGPLFARDGDRNRSEQISYRILRGGKRLRGGGADPSPSRFLQPSPPPPPPSGNEGNIFQIDEETGNISMSKAADIAGPITLTVLVRAPLGARFCARFWGV